MRILVGSHAIVFRGNLNRRPNDVDFFSPEPVDGAETFWDDRLLDYDWAATGFRYPVGTYGDILIPTLDELYTIKISHLFWPVKWVKHASDVIQLQNQGATLVPELYDILYPIWEDHYGKKKASLKGKKADFFDDIIDRIYDHDSVHESVAYGDRPLYELILKPDTVAVDRDKWEALTHEQKVNMVREEIYATALERYLIPVDYQESARAAYARTLEKTLTSLTKGWFALFCAENLRDLWVPDIDYVQRHHDKSDRLVRL